MFKFIVMLLVVGAVAGFLARLLVPGRNRLSIPQTVLLGVVGSFVGGFLGWWLFGHNLSEGALQPSGIIGSVIGAVVALLAFNAMKGRGRAKWLRRLRG
jgi:uncharacterized membrane protein YeaQ/YmgE (transglycosylase-associated protein family)